MSISEGRISKNPINFPSTLDANALKKPYFKGFYSPLERMMGNKPKQDIYTS